MNVYKIHEKGFAIREAFLIYPNVIASRDGGCGEGATWQSSASRADLQRTLLAEDCRAIARKDDLVSAFAHC